VVLPRDVALPQGDSAVFANYNDTDFGYLRVTIDLANNVIAGEFLTIDLKSDSPAKLFDSFELNLGVAHAALASRPRTHRRSTMREDTNKDTSTSSKAGAAGLTSIFIPALFTLFGTIIGVIGNGFYNLQLERPKADTDLVKLAVQSQDEGTRIERLRFMVSVNLIQDSQIRNGVLKLFTKTTSKLRESRSASCSFGWPNDLYSRAANSSVC
jgi:hypothetical protein